MELEQWTSVGYCEQSYVQIFGLFVQFSLKVHTYSTCAFIKDAENWFVVEQSCHSHTLFFSTWKNIFPVLHWVKAIFSFFDVLKSDVFQKESDVIITFSFLLHGASGVRVNHLISESSWRQVRSLRDVKKLFNAGSFKSSSCKGPKSAQNSEKWALAASIGSSDNSVDTFSDLKGHRFDKDIPSRSHNRNISKPNKIFNFNSFANVHLINWINLQNLVLSSWNLSSDKFPFLKIIKHLIHFIDKRSETCKLLNLFVRNDYSSNSFGQVNQKRWISDVISCDCTAISSYFFDILFFVGSENRKSQDGKSHHNSSIFDKHRVKDTHKESFVHDSFTVSN